jgi:hypothetical protein
VNQMKQTATYRRVAILRPGEYMDMMGQRVAFSAEDLEQIADGYDPIYHAAPVNIDHSEDGPALGTVSDLIWDGEVLCADITGVPPEVASDVDAGRYPFRSAEVYADLEGRGPYLRAVALLGARPPAVKGLPAMPPREKPGAEKSNIEYGRSTASPLQQGQQSSHIIHIISEVYMSQNKTSRDAAPATPGSTEGAGGDPLRLAEENQRLATENRRLKREELRRGVACFLAELRDVGKLTPAMEQSGIEEALLASDEQQVMVALGEGRQLPLGDVLREVLRALPVSYGTSELAPPEDALPGLSPEEREIAAKLGLSEQEYAEIKES